MLLELHKINRDLIKPEFEAKQMYLDNDEFLNVISYHFKTFGETPAVYANSEVIERLFSIGDKSNYKKKDYESLLDITLADLVIRNVIHDVKDKRMLKINSHKMFTVYFVSFLFEQILMEFDELHNEDELGHYSFISEDTFRQVLYSINTIKYYSLVNEKEFDFLVTMILNDMIDKITMSSEHYGLYYKNSVITIERRMILLDYGSNVKMRQSYIDKLQEAVNEEYQYYDCYDFRIRR